MAAYGFYNFQELISQWESVGVFDIILPMILIFTVVYAILDRTSIFGKGKSAVNAVIALAISFFTIQNVAVTGFFKILFSQVAFGIAILIAAILLTAIVLGSKKNHVWKFAMMAIGIGVFIWVLSRAADQYQQYYGAYAFGLFTSQWWAMNASWIVLVIIIIAVVLAVVSSNSSGTGGTGKFMDVIKSFVGEDDS